MQILKEEVHNKIINAAKEEFLEYGYSGASMRRISKKIGMTVGNIYRYFSSKEDLFHKLLEPSLNEIEDIFNSLGQEEFMNSTIEELIEVITNYIMTARRKYKGEFLILIDGCEGSGFESIKEEWIAEMATKIRTSAMNLFSEKEMPFDLEFFPQIIAEAWLESMVKAIKLIEDEKELERNLRAIERLYLGYFMNERKHEIVRK